jgi:hypothetical protein
VNSAADTASPSCRMTVRNRGPYRPQLPPNCSSTLNPQPHTFADFGGLPGGSGALNPDTGGCLRGVPEGVSAPLCVSFALLLPNPVGFTDTLKLGGLRTVARIEVSNIHNQQDKQRAERR